MTAMTIDIPVLETDRLILRAPGEADLDHEAAFFASDASRFVGGPLPAHRMWRNLALFLGHWAMRGYGFWALEDKATGTYQGRVGLWFPKGWYEREIGWTLMPHATGRGYATEAAKAVRAHAYGTLGWDTAVSQIDPRNDASRAVARRLGATFETTYQDPEYGTIEVWRHLSPAQVAAKATEPRA